MDNVTPRDENTANENSPTCMLETNAGIVSFVTG
jgi:hypothetical protein